MIRHFFLTFLILLQFACSSGSQESAVGTGAGPLSCDGSCVNANSFLTVAEVQTIIAQAVFEAQLQNADVTVAVVDRVGNVLGVFSMNAAAGSAVTIDSGRGVVGGLEGIAIIPDTAAAIAKAVTGAYLSSEGNAFSTRTASQIVQEHFNPREFGQPAGPLFGVQFSNLPCSDLNTRFSAGRAGPHRSPLGLSADLGGMPLYKGGVPVGGIGVIADGVYGLDLNITDRDRDLDEMIAVAGSYGFAAPIDRRERVTLDGKVARFSDVDFSDLASNPLSAPAFAAITGGVVGNLVTVPGYYTAAALPLPGEIFGQPASGIRPDALDYPGLDAFVLVDNADAERYRPMAGTDGASALTAAEVQQLISSALAVANRSRAQIRRPVGSQARVTVSVVDTNGVILGIARTRDGPIFGTDVSLQKARTAVFFSGPNAAADLTSAPDTIYRNPNGSASGVTITIGDYVAAAQTFLGDPNALTNGAIAFADRSGGNLARPFYPDGINSAPNGPFSKPFNSWSPFTDGLQLDLVMNEVVTHVLFILNMGPDTLQNCAGIDIVAPARQPLQNGIQIFPGSVPIYRGNILIGGIGVSGDGVDQDDMISFLGVDEAGKILGTINNAPKAMRADTLVPKGTRLRYVQCPQAPYINSNQQNVCSGK